jgi:energy-converting hydrogenase Eha subunit A
VHPRRLLFTLLGIVPLCVLGAGIAAFLLQRAGYGILVWALAPLAGLLVVAVVVGGIFGRAAGRYRRNSSRDDV